MKLITMTKELLVKKKLPDAPGVYFFLGRRKEILYIGKATSLKTRVRSYFDPAIKDKRSALIEQMVGEAKSVDFTETDSVLEALILETNLIRTHKPKFNTRSKDDKSYNHLIITNEEFPRVLVVRGKDLTEKYSEDDIQYCFGPFPSGLLFREALKILKRIFQFYDTKDPIGKEKSKMARGKIDFNRQIGLFPGVQSKEEYRKTIRHIRMFFEGKKHRIIGELEKEMMKLAKNEKFEEASAIKRKVFALKHIQDIALIKEDLRAYRDDKTVRIEAYDIAHLGGSDMVGVMTVVEGRVADKNEYRKFKIKSLTGSNDPGALKEVLDRRLRHPEWRYPDIIVVDGSTAQKNAAEHVLRKYSVIVPVVGVVKDEKHNPKRVIGPRTILEKHHDAILLANAEAHRFAISYHREKRRKRSLA
jgi:excinuclease ABC subunit C